MRNHMAAKTDRFQAGPTRVTLARVVEEARRGRGRVLATTRPVATRVVFMHVLVVVGAVLSGTVCGCARQGVVSFQYGRPAEFQLPARIGRVAIADLGGTTERDGSWGRAVADSLAELATTELVGERKWNVVRLRDYQPLAEGRTPASMPATAPWVATVPPGDADALIVGWANVMVRDEQVAVTPASPPPTGAPLPTAKRRYAVGTVDFQLIEAAGDKVLATVHVTEQFDSLRPSNTIAATSRPATFAPAEIPSVEDVMRQLARRAGRQFLARFVPHRVTVSQELKAGRHTQAGNRAAARGEYAKALKRYQDAIAAEPADAAAMFNAALMCEALNRLDEAARYAARAAVLGNDPDYINMGKRLRGELPQ